MSNAFLQPESDPLPASERRLLSIKSPTDKQVRLYRQLAFQVRWPKCTRQGRRSWAFWRCRMWLLRLAFRFLMSSRSVITPRWTTCNTRRVRLRLVFAWYEAQDPRWHTDDGGESNTMKRSNMRPTHATQKGAGMSCLRAGGSYTRTQLSVHAHARATEYM